MTDEPTSQKSTEEENRTLRNYIPLMVIVTLSALAGAARQASGAGTPTGWMHDFMGVFLVMFSMFKFFNLPGFADGFEMYDLLAKRVRAYAYLYPFLELGLGLAYLARFQLTGVYVFTIALMLFGAAGVLIALKNNLKINCPCMGTVLDVPLSTVTLTEDLGMAAMAALMLTL